MNIELDKIETDEVPNEELNFESEPKRKRGRPRKNKIDDDFEQTQQNVNINFDFIFDIVVDRLPNKIPLNELERKNLNDVTNAIVNKYLPMVAGYDIEISFILVVSSVILPRLQKQNEQNEQNETKE